MIVAALKRGDRSNATLFVHVRESDQSKGWYICETT